MPGTEKRRFKRRRILVQVGIVYRGDYFYETACEISEGGMLLRVTNEYGVGDMIEVCFVADSGDLIEERVEVVYRLKGPDRSEYIGVRFTDISPDNKKMIHNLVER